MKSKFLLLVFILMLVMGTGIRFYKLSNPLDGIHSWRQADTAAVSRNYVREGIDLLHPHFDDLSNVPSGLDNPQGYRYVEFPIYNFFQAELSTISNLFTLEEWGRIITIFSSVLTGVFLYLLVRKYVDEIAALCVFGVFLFLPFSFYYGRVILPDPSMSMTALGAVYFFDLYIQIRKKSLARGLGILCVSLILAATSLLLKPFAAFFLLPIAWLSLVAFRQKVFLRWELYLYAILAVIPLILWRLWIQHYPAGIPASDWLFNGGNIRFTGAYFYWIYSQRIATLILGYFGVAFLIMGVIWNSAKQAGRGLFYSILLGALLYTVVIARGNVQHDYYQILILPALALFTGLGIKSLIIFEKKSLTTYIQGGTALVCILFMLAFGWYGVKSYYTYDAGLVASGQEIDASTPKNALVVTSRDGDTTFLYYMNRKGWSSFAHPLPDLIKQGAQYLVIAYPKTEDLGLANTYSLIHRSDAYLLFDLTKNP
jgi:4-amino-4-deoxy-L-arabinose transferase-like glycosyltransferase